MPRHNASDAASPKPSRSDARTTRREICKRLERAWADDPTSRDEVLRLINLAWNASGLHAYETGFEAGRRDGHVQGWREGYDEGR